MRSVTLKLFIVLIFVVSLIPLPSFAGPIDTLQPGHWYEVPNSKIRNMVPNPLPPGYTGPTAVTGAWSGGAYDSTRDCFIVTGGGHGDYAGNELYSMCLNTLQWQRIWGPTPNASIPPLAQAGTETYLNGDPASVHTYGGLQYLPNVDRLWRFGGSLWGGSGGFGKVGWSFNFASSTWQQKAAGIYPYGTIPYSAYDPVTGHVFVHRYNRFEEYDPAADTWTTRGSYGPGGTPAATAVIDPVRRKFFLIGGGAVQQYDLSQGTSNLTTIPTSGDTAPVFAAYPGAEYDPVSDRIVAWIGGAEVYTLDLSTFVWTKVPPASTNTVIPTNPSGTGTHGRWRYVPSKNAFIIVNSIDQNVYVYKLGTSSPSTSPSFNFSLANGGAKSVEQGQSTVNSITASLTSGTSQPISFSTSGLPSGTSSNYTLSSCTPTCSVNLSISTTTSNPTGSYTVTVTASGGGITRTTSFTLTVNSPTSPPSSGGWVNIPLQTWVARALPSGYWCSRGVCKHTAVAHNPDDGRVYFLGGDHDGSGGGQHQSGRNELYSYDVATDTWRLVQPFCRTDSGPEPNGPDEVGWTYDTTRKVFWMQPGYMWNHSGICSGVQMVAGQTMTYSPITGKWAIPNIAVSPRGNLGNFTQYDPVTDTLIRFNDAGPEVNVYSFATNTWTRKGWGLPNLNFSDTGTTIDVTGRAIYLATGNRLWRYNIDTMGIADLGPTPESTIQENKPVWDPVNKVLLWPVFYDTDNSQTGDQEQLRLHVYHPNTKTWETNLPVNISVKGRHAIFDPGNNVLLVGGNTWNTPGLPSIFLYRYGNGSGTTSPPPQTVSVPLAPTNLSVQ